MPLIVYSLTLFNKEGGQQQPIRFSNSVLPSENHEALDAVSCKSCICFEVSYLYMYQDVEVSRWVRLLTCLSIVLYKTRQLSHTFERE